MSDTAQWPEECPIGRGVTGIGNKRTDEPQMMVVGVCDWRKDPPTRTTYDEAQALTDEIRRRWRAAAAADRMATAVTRHLIAQNNASNDREAAATELLNAAQGYEKAAK